jgi:hypothetical protein
MNDSMQPFVAAQASAVELAPRGKGAGSASGKRGASGLTADEADLLAVPPLGVHAPWVVPLTVRPDDDNSRRRYG